MDLGAVNLIDLAAVCLLVGGLVGGLRSGASPQIGGLIGAILGAVALVAVAPALRGWVATLQNPSRAIVVIAILVMAIGVGEVLGSTGGRAVSRALGDGVLGTFDRMLGGFVGIVQSVVTVWLVGSLLAAGPASVLATEAQRSIAVRITTRTFPPIGTVAADVGGLIDSSGLPQVFIGLEPIPAPPVDTPATAQARRIAVRAMASTAEVNSRACEYELTGTGFVVAPGYLVTNAHVVAGASSTSVSIDGALADASVVFFDPRLDVAVLYAPTIGAPALHFATADPTRGTQAAALGHPGGAPLTVIPAAVADSYLAQGRDLYGSGTVTREILELRASIARGDSGGPLVLADGSVGGVVFAESKTDSSVGYALSPTAVWADMAHAIGDQHPVDTGACIR